MGREINRTQKTKRRENLSHDPKRRPAGHRRRTPQKAWAPRAREKQVEEKGRAGHPTPQTKKTYPVQENPPTELHINQGEQEKGRTQPRKTECCGGGWGKGQKRGCRRQKMARQTRKQSSKVPAVKLKALPLGQSVQQEGGTRTKDGRGETSPGQLIKGLPPQKPGMQPASEDPPRIKVGPGTQIGYGNNFYDGPRGGWCGKEIRQKVKTVLHRQESCLEKRGAQWRGSHGANHNSDQLKTGPPDSQKTTANGRKRTRTKNEETRQGATPKKGKRG